MVEEYCSVLIGFFQRFLGFMFLGGNREAAEAEGAGFCWAAAEGVAHFIWQSLFKGSQWLRS